MTDLPHLIGGDWREGGAPFTVTDPYRNEPVARAWNADPATVSDAVAAAVEASAAMATMPGHERAAVLHRAGTLLVERADDIALAMARETGKAIKDARGEVRRTQDTMTLSAEEAIRIEGQHVPLEGSAMGAGKLAMLLRFPVGVVAGISPFNAPVNLACHKIAPALAAGNAIVLKPPPQAAWCVQKLVQVFVDAGVPRGAVNAIHGGAETGRALVQDPRVDFVTFTGSSRAGAEIKAMSGLRRVALELGGIGPTIVHADGDVEKAAPLAARNAMRLAGQSCMSVQTLYLHEAVYDRFVARFVAEVEGMTLGDPLEETTDIGTLISAEAAKRVESWIGEAEAGGARILTGGRRQGAQLQPTVMADVDPAMKLVCQEVFGPVASVVRYSDVDAVFARVNASRYGLHCGLFTDSTALALKAIRTLKVGGVIVNGTSTWRTDQMPYGGIKDSGIGREGPRYAIRDMTDEKLVVWNEK